MSNILVIEDDPTTLNSIVDLLEAENFEVTAATDGDIALEIIKYQKVDAIVCDLLLPNLNGYEVLSALRKNTNTADIPFIVLTGKGRREDISLGKKVGVSDYIVKPFVNQELIQSIRSKIETKKFLEKCYQADYPQTDNLLERRERNKLTQNKEKLNRERTTNSSLADRFNKIVGQYVNQKVDAGSNKITSIAVCCLSLNGLAQLNNSLSKEQNQSIVQIVLQRLNNAIGNKAKITHLQNGDFVLIFPYVKHLNRAIELIKIARNSLRKPLVTKDMMLDFTPYVGICFAPTYSQNVKNLVVRARKALQQAKQNSDDCYEVYDPNVRSPLNSLNYRSLTLYDDLWNALPNKELSLCYQPQIDLVSGKVIGCEALLRWHHPQLGNIPPSTFIPIAEDSKVIGSIEQWSMRTAFEQLTTWHQQGHQNLKLAINISGSQFNRHDFIDSITSALNRVGLAAKFLTIEVAEQVLLQNPKNSIEKLSELKSLGIEVAIANFATGYAALSYLEQFSFNVLKVDISRLQNLLGVKDSQVALQNMFNAATRLNIQVIVEKVETHKQLNFLRQNRFRTAQGNFLSLPATINKLELLLQNKYNRLLMLFSFPPL